MINQVIVNVCFRITVTVYWSNFLRCPTPSPQSTLRHKGAQTIPYPTYIHQNKYGNYFYRYVLPTWFIRRFPNHKKRIYISLLTKGIDVAKIHTVAQYFYE
ncbi:MAG: hypothetical protein JKY84_09545 [Emcibacteraceae bacterium]|nr:hypothetical protein [Emcibacteraceae bacterium]